MGRNLGSAFRQELANLDKDPDTNKTAMSNLRTIVKDLNPKVIHVFLAQVSETKEIGSESGGYTVSLFEDLARSHGVKLAPHVDTIMPVIIRTLSSCEGSLGVQQACSKAVAAMARYGVDPATPEDKKRNVIHSLCKPLSESLLDTQHQQHLALGSALCLKSLVDCDSWRFASSEVVNSVCQSLAVALEATSSEAKAHMALVIALAKHNPFIVEAYARLLVKSGLRILELGVVEGDSQKRLLAVQMLNFLMKYLNPKSICSELELIYKEMEKHLKDEMYFVKVAAYETMSTAERLIGESAEPKFNAESIKSTPRLRAHSGSYVNEQEEEDVLFNGVASGRTVVSGSPLVYYADYNRETGDVCSNHHKHGFAQDPFTELVENRQQMQRYSESYSSSSIYDTSGTTTGTPTEDICEKPKSDLDSEAKVMTGETETVSRKARSKCVLRWGLSFFSVAVAGFAMWVHLNDDMMMPPHLVPT
ncbi:hypothetical protein HID58_020205 [Brassica napus]|uniref:TORTIFOLIA1/SINE1-2 N-terminal domain-containing protein n=1 Tax=Brassica napus TaxID=3708 RepID=A0ABQ8DEZ7_BRANA|nr:hypothetical protein HID58_020205 [Brassica napus]